MTCHWLLVNVHHEQIIMYLCCVYCAQNYLCIKKQVNACIYFYCALTLKCAVALPTCYPLIQNESDRIQYSLKGVETVAILLSLLEYPPDSVFFAALLIALVLPPPLFNFYYGIEKQNYPPLMDFFIGVVVINKFSPQQLYRLIYVYTFLAFL